MAMDFEKNIPLSPLSPCLLYLHKICGQPCHPPYNFSNLRLGEAEIGGALVPLTRTWGRALPVARPVAKPPFYKFLLKKVNLVENLT
jgi:hypothetical protein